MLMKEYSDSNWDNPDDIGMEDEGVLADGMIPDSRIVKLIDELEIMNDEDFDDGGDTESTLKSLGLR